MKYEIIKGSEKDFDSAPSEALYVLNCLGSLYYSADMKTTYCGIDMKDSDRRHVIAERRPITEPVWSGAGLPPVGVECEAKYKDAANAEWVAFRCVGVDCGVAFGWAGKEAVALDKGSYDFRPIRSPEDVARDEAKGIIAELCRSSASNGHSADLIYDAIAAGKIPGVTLSGK